MGLAQGTTYFETNLARSVPFIPQGEGVSDHLAAWLLDPIARLLEFVPVGLLPHPPHLESIIPTTTYLLMKVRVVSFKSYSFSS